MKKGAGEAEGEAVPVISENESESIYVVGGIYGKDGWDRNSKF